MEIDRHCERQLLNDLRNGDGEEGKRRKSVRSMMIDDGRPSLLSAHRPSVLLATGGDLRCDPTRSPC